MCAFYWRHSGGSVAADTGRSCGDGKEEGG